MVFSEIDKHKVSRLGLGLAALGRPGYINLGHDKDFSEGKSKQEMEQRAHEMIDLAKQLDINYFDTARGYGLGEAFLANFENLSSDDVIGSKWGYRYTAGWKTDTDSHEVKDLSVDHFLSQLEESKSILGDRLNIYHIHSATTESGVLDDQELIEQLWKLNDAGITVGLSVSVVKQKETIEKALSITRASEQLFKSVQATFNILKQSCHDTLKMAHEQGAGVIIKEGVANGRLTSRNSEIDDLALIRRLKEKYNCSLDALALAFILQQAWVDVVLSGASTAAQLLSNAKALSITLDPEDFKDLKSLEESSEAYWKKRSALNWN